MTETSDLRRSLGYALLVAAAVLAAATLAFAEVIPNIAPWYAALHKPSFNPPDWVFGPVWTILYVLMIFAGWRILRLPETFPGRSAALWGFFAQLTLNAVWSWLFFGNHNPFLGLIDIVPQLAVILWTIRRVYGLDRLAAWALVPLAAWVAFAAVLNFAIWQLNGA